MRTTLEEKKKQYYIIYGLIHENPRVLPSAISKVIKTGPKTADLQFKEIVYSVRCKDQSKKEVI